MIVGAGISGISVSRMLSDRFSVKILERASMPGGLIKCDRIGGVLFHRVGGHVFNSKNQSVLEWFWKHFDREKEFTSARRNARILMDDTYIGYPLEDYLYQLPEKQVRSIIEDISGLIAASNQPTPDNFKDFLINSFGKTLYELYFGPYNSKIWNTDISKVPLEWLEGKLPMPSKKNILINNILRREESDMVHATFYYPKKDGSQFIINRLAENQDIALSYEVKDIKKTADGQLLINDDLQASYLIYCGDVRQLHRICKIEDAELEQAMDELRDLSSNGTSNMLCETDSNDISWLYLPEKKYRAHRIIYTGNFSETNNNPTGRKTCVVEFSGKQVEEDMLNEIRLLPGNLKPLSFNYEENSYIIHDKKTREKISKLKAQLKKHNIFLLGRFAEWEYHNMDKCIESAMELNSQLEA